jgi:hypothetical protein
MVFTRILGRLGGCWRRQRKSLQESLKSRDRDLPANVTLPEESDSHSVDSYLIEDVMSTVTEASLSAQCDDWSYSVVSSSVSVDGSNTVSVSAFSQFT